MIARAAVVGQLCENVIFHISGRIIRRSVAVVALISPVEVESLIAQSGGGVGRKPADSTIISEQMKTIRNDINEPAAAICVEIKLSADAGAETATASSTAEAAKAFLMRFIDSVLSAATEGRFQ